MSFAFLPLYTGDYRRDTQHLSPTRHGIYLLLLMHCWDTREPVPLDEDEQCGICNCRSDDETSALRYILGRYFTKMGDGWYNERMQAEIERAENISGARSDAGRKGYEARSQAIAKQVLSNCQASASTPTPTLTPSLTTTEERLVRAARPDPPKPKKITKGTRLPEGWRCPDEWIDWALEIRPDWTRRGVHLESITFRDYWHAKAGAAAIKVSWWATWRNWIRRAEHEPVR